MLDPWIIDKIRRREEEKRRERDAARIELPLYEEVYEDSPKQTEPDEPERGVVIMDI